MNPTWISSQTFNHIMNFFEIIFLKKTFFKMVINASKWLTADGDSKTILFSLILTQSCFQFLRGHQVHDLNIIDDPNYHQNQVGDVPAFCLEVLPQTSTSQSYENQVRKYEACTPLFAPNECKSKGKRDDDSDGDQVRQLQEQLSQKDNDMASIMAQMKVITASLAEKANPWSDTSTLQIYNQKDPYSSKVSSSSNKEFNWQ